MMSIAIETRPAHDTNDLLFQETVRHKIMDLLKQLGMSSKVTISNRAFALLESQCETCEGTKKTTTYGGTIEGQTCWRCHGSGVRTVSRCISCYRVER